MRFDQAQAAKAYARRAYEPIEYPKWVKVDGKDVMALDADHEAELLGPEDDSPPADGLTAGGEQMNNLLSAPEKRKGGRPRLVRDEDGNIIRNIPPPSEQENPNE